jgi:IS30 family transposase
MKKLTRDERCEISALYKSGKSPSEISKQLSRSISTITRELSRNSIDGHYDFITANEAAIKRRGKHNNHSITLDNWTYVRSLIRQKWSPDQVDNWLKSILRLDLLLAGRAFISISKMTEIKVETSILASEEVERRIDAVDLKNIEARLKIVLISHKGQIL